MRDRKHETPPTAISQNLPRRIFIIVLTLTSFLLALLGRFSWQSYHQWQVTATKIIKLQELIATIRTSDEILTMSARMAAATGDSRWEERYLESEPELAEAIGEAMKILPDPVLIAALSKTGEANIALVAMEKNSFELLRRRQSALAGALLTSEEYEKQKLIYGDGISEALAYIGAYIDGTLETQQRRALSSFLSALAVILISVGAWILVLRISRQYLSDRNGIEEELRQSRIFLDTIFDNLPVIIVIKETEGLRYTGVNRAVEDILGYSRENLLGRDDYTLTGRSPREADVITASDRAVLESGIPLDIPRETIRTYKGETRILHTRKIPIAMGEGGPEYLLTFSEDITERIERERVMKQLEEEKNLSRRIESVGTLAGGIAHDFNNLLQGVFGYITLAREEGEDPKKREEYLKEAEGAMDMAVNLTNKLLTFSRGGKPRFSEISPLTVINDAVRFALHSSRLTCRIEAEGNIGSIRADRDQISQVLQNILRNAAQAMAGEGEILLGIKYVRRGEGTYLEISVTDRGSGIPGENLNRIFEPYFTTKDMGNGLGLATSFSIVRNHGGTITVESELGRGSTFRILLPSPGAEA